jgi:hypothetical protein
VPGGEPLGRIQRLLADRHQLALEGVLIGDLRIAGDDRLAHHRHRLDDACAKPREIRRHLAPTQQDLPLGADEMLDVLHRDRAGCRLARQKAHGGGVAAGRREIDRLLARPIPQQRVRDLDQAAGAIADQRIGPCRAAVIEIDQDLQAALNDVVRLQPLDVRDEADAARIVLVARIVQALSLRQRHPACFSPKRRRNAD